VRMVARTTGGYYGTPMTAGDIYTVAGDGTSGYAGDEGAATSAWIESPDGIIVDNAGEILVSQTGGIRRVAGGDPKALALAIHEHP